MSPVLCDRIPIHDSLSATWQLDKQDPKTRVIETARGTGLIDAQGRVQTMSIERAIVLGLAAAAVTFAVRPVSGYTSQNPRSLVGSERYHRPQSGNAGRLALPRSCSSSFEAAIPLAIILVKRHRPLTRRAMMADETPGSESSRIDVRPAASDRPVVAHQDSGTDARDGGTQKSSPPVGISQSRVGGRIPSRSGSSASVPVASGNDSLHELTKKWRVLFIIAPLLFFGWLFQSILPSSPPSSMVYYQSSVYESRVLGPDGKMETARKESFRSNIPSLLENERRLQQDKGSSSSLIEQRNDYDSSFDREVDSMIRRMDRSLWDDFF
jgi:hypothetical protein